MFPFRNTAYVPVSEQVNPVKLSDTFEGVRMEIRPVRQGDNEAVKNVIHTVMPEFGASGDGFAIHDTEVAAMYEAYRDPRSAYFVVTDGERVVGGGGIAPLAGSDGTVCELRKMYFLPEARGKGMGKAMLERCLSAARERAFRVCYLETLKTMSRARQLYANAGFRPIEKPMGNTGHFGCDAWYVLEL